MNKQPQFILTFGPSAFRRLKAEAAEAGKSVEEYIISLLTASAEKEACAANRKGSRYHE